MIDFSQGYKIIEDFITQDELRTIRDELESYLLPECTGGIRNIDKKSPAVAILANSAFMLTQAGRYLTGTTAFVRAIFFDKTRENNWLVSWHQDRSLAVSTPFKRPGWEPWSIKDGVHHVQPPEEVLEKMITFRIHLDKTNRENGCLRLIPGSHTMGLLSPTDIQQYTSAHEPVYCEVPAGSALAMRPHLLHSSSKATNPSRRRVLHLEYCSYKLPKGVEWA